MGIKEKKRLEGINFRTIPSSILFLMYRLVQLIIAGFLLFPSMNVFGQEEGRLSLRKKLLAARQQENFMPTDTAYLNLLGRYGWSMKIINPDTMNLLGDELETLSKKANYEPGILKSKLLKANAFMLTGDYTQGFKSAEEAERMAEEIGDTESYMIALNAQGLGHFRQRDFDQVFQINRRGLAYAEKNNNPKMAIKFNINGATILSMIEEYDRSLTMFGEAKKLVDETEQPFQMAQIENNQALLYFKKEEFSKAVELSEKALVVFARMEEWSWAADALTTMGNSTLNQGNYPLAKTYFDTAIDYLKQTNDPIRKSNAYNGLGRWHLTTNQVKQSDSLARLSLALARKSSFRIGELEALDLLQKSNLILKNSEAALDFANKYQILSKEISSSNEAYKLKIRLAENEIALKNSRNEKQLLEQRQVLVLLILLAIGLLLSVFFIRWKYRIQKKYTAELKEANDTKDKLFSILAHDLKNPFNTLQELLVLYQDEQLTEEDFQGITKRLKENVHLNSLMLDNLLFWAKNQMSSLKTEQQETGVKEALTSVIELKKEELNQKLLQVEVEIEDNLSVLMQQEHLKILFRNLLSNAIKYSPPSAKINIRSTKKESQVEIAFQDQGHGIEDEKIRQIEERRFFDSKPGTIGELGNGLGLFLVKDIIDGYKGDLVIESSANLGSTFRVRLN